MIQTIECKNLIAGFVEGHIRHNIGLDAVGIFGNPAPSHVVPPRGGLNIIESYVLASVCLVAPDNARWERTTDRHDVLQSNVANINQSVRLAGLERVSETAGASAIGLLLLLWADVDAPPDWVVHVKVLVPDVADFT